MLCVFHYLYFLTQLLSIYLPWSAFWACAVPLPLSLLTAHPPVSWSAGSICVYQLILLYLYVCVLHLYVLFNLVEKNNHVYK